MLRLVNRTPFKVEGTLQLDRDGREIWVVIVKGTFMIRGEDCELAEHQEPVVLTDVFTGQPGSSSIRYASEISFDKPATDVVVNGNAWAPDGRPSTQLDVEVYVSSLHKTVRVFGDRVWERSWTGVAPGSPRKFEKIPLLYENAFGGTDSTGQHAEPWNPIGRGYGLSTRELVDQPLPNLEDPRDLIRSGQSRPKPTGLGFVARHWQPRLRFAGTYDQRWQEQRAPLWPADFDPQFFQAASPELTAFPPLRGGELVKLCHLTPSGILEFRLPRTWLAFRTCIGRQWVTHEARLGTVILEPDVPRVLMVWQTAVPCHRQRFEISATVISEKPHHSKGGTL